MALMFSGSRGVVEELLKLGIKPRWCIGNWLGPWTDQAQIDGHIAWCKSVGVTPAFQFFYWGDEICLEALKGTYSPVEYGGKAESVAAYWALAKLLADRIKASGVQGILVSIESEWNKRGPHLPTNAGLHSVTDEPAVFDQIFADTAGVMHSAPGTLIVTCPGQWMDLNALLSKYPKMVASTDFVATQGLNTLYHQTEAGYVAGADRLLAKVKELANGGHGKPVLVMDTAFSSYSGSYTDTKPYAAIAPATEDSNLRAGEAGQEKAMARLKTLLPQFEAAGLKALFYRGLRDAQMDTANYWGFFERGWGVVRKDGTKKPAFDELLSLAQAATSPPAPQSPPDPCADVKAALAAAEARAQSLAAEVAALKGKLANISAIASGP
jgi:hypothetical protein